MSTLSRMQETGQAPFIELGRPREKGYSESFNGRLRHELLDREITDTLTELRIPIDGWWQNYNAVRPHRAPVVGTPRPP